MTMSHRIVCAAVRIYIFISRGIAIALVNYC